MGTLVIEEWAGVGTQDDTGAQVYSGQIAATEDATTTTADETVTTSGATRYVFVFSVSGDHRVSINSSTVTSSFAYIAEGTGRALAIRGGDVVAYEATA